MQEGNPQIQVGVRYDTGKKWVDASGVPHVIYQKALSVGALVNNTTKNVAHGEALNVVSKYTNVVALWASNGTIVKTLASTGITADINATNVVVGTTTDLTTYINGVVVIEFCL